MNTVIWSTMSQKTEVVARGRNHFSHTGEDGQPQPDNFAFRANNGQGLQEHCVAVLNNRYGDGIVLHDLLCNARLPVVCQEIDFKMMSPEDLLKS